eukprot:m.42377 g.42377  ORF g.42377 m.42377 type:complete len:400 (+) comp11539_c0_seq1:118-1317(+)
MAEALERADAGETARLPDDAEAEQQEEVAVEEEEEEEWQDPMSGVDLDDIEDELAALTQSNDVFQRQVTMFEGFLARSGHDAASEKAPAQAEAVKAQSTRKLASKAKASKPEAVVAAVPQTLTAAQKCLVAEKELEVVKADANSRTDALVTEVMHYRALLETADIRTKELAKATLDFERDIVRGAINPKTGNVVTERVVVAHQARLKDRDTVIDKLQLKTTGLKSNKRKLLQQLAQRGEVGDSLHEVDFHQLRIENDQYAERIDERAKEVLRLKTSSAKTNKQLTRCKKQLTTLALQSEQLLADVQARRQLASKIAAELGAATQEREAAQKTNTKLRKQKQAFKVPAVMDYMQEQAEAAQLKKAVANWEEKVRIAEVDLERFNRTRRGSGNRMSRGGYP